VYDPDRPDGRLNFLTASTFDQPGQYTSSPGRMAYLTTATLKFSSLAIAVTIANAAGAYPQKGGQAELAWVAGIARWFSCPKAVTHPTTGRARRRATSLTETNALTLVAKLRDRQLA